MPEIRPSLSRLTRKGTHELQVRMRWQVQEAKQRFSELLRQVHDDGPQAITRHGEEVAVVVDIAWYREMTGEKKDLTIFLTQMPHGDELARELEHVRSREPARSFDFSDEIDSGARS